MKTLMILAVLISLSLAQDSSTTYQFDLDFSGKITFLNIVEKFGIPEKEPYIMYETNMVFEYPNLKCNTYLDGATPVLYSMEVTGGKFNGFEIGMSKNKVKRIFNLEEDEFTSRIMHNFQDNNNNYNIELKFEKNKLVKILIYS